MLGIAWDSLGWIGKAWDGLEKLGMDWKSLEWIEKAWDGLEKLRRAWDTLGYLGIALDNFGSWVSRILDMNIVLTNPGLISSEGREEGPGVLVRHRGQVPPIIPAPGPGPRPAPPLLDMFVAAAISGVAGPAQRTLRAGHVVAAVAGGGAVGVLERSCQ